MSNEIQLANLQKSSQPVSHLIVNSVATLFFIAGIALYATRNLSNTYFWGDEASSFFSSLGWPSGGQIANDMQSFWTWNLGGLEPGLFNLFERFWALGIGTDIVSLRTYPFLFFLIYIGALLVLTRLVRAPWVLGCAVVSVMLLENITPYYAVELRPSISGLAASVVLPLAAVLLVLIKSTGKGLLVYVPIFLVFGTLQYQSVTIIVGTSSLLIVASLAEPAKTKRITLRIVALVSLAWLPIIYVLSFGNPFTLAGGGAAPNIANVYISNMSADEVVRTIFTNFLSLTALPRTVFIVLLPVLWLISRYARPTKESDDSERVVNGLWVVVVMATLASFAGGILGFFPWVLGTRWSIAEIGLIALSVVGLAGVLAQSRLMNWKWFRIGVVVVSLLLCAVGAYRIANYERPPGVNWNPMLERLLSGEPGGVEIDPWTFPELKYWVEYSGQYGSFLPTWNEKQVRLATSDPKADAQAVEEFLRSDSDRLLLRSETLLDGALIPPAVQIYRAEFWNGSDDSAYDIPILLIKSQG